MFIKFIMPCYNGAANINRQLDSILNQTFQDFHIVCVNDCSTDNTLQILKSYKQKYPTKITIIENNVNLGTGESKNRGFYLTENTVKSEFIWLIDEDDRLADIYVLQKIYDFHKNNSQYDMICLGVSICNNYRIANINSPTAGWGSILKSNCYQPYLNEKVYSCEDVYQHFVQWDSIDDNKIGSFDYLCYIWERAGGHMIKTNSRQALIENSRQIIIDALKKYPFKKESVKVALRNFKGAHVNWYT